MSSVSKPKRAVIIGDPGSGKTAILIRKERGVFEETRSTVATSMITYSQHIGSDVINISVLDTPGQQSFTNVVSSFLRDALVVIICFDITNSATYKHIPQWVEFVSSNVQPLRYYIVGNKIDLESDREVETSDALDWASEHGMSYIETSALRGCGIEELFSDIARFIYEQSEPQPEDVHVSTLAEGEKKKSCCYQ